MSGWTPTTQTSTTTTRGAPAAVSTAGWRPSISRTEASRAALGEAFYSEEARVFEAERRAILELAEKGDCVIIGRCASAILRAAGYRPLSVFIYADSADRTKRIAARNNLDEKRALHKAQKVDRMRKHHFDFYADTLWGEPESYDLMLSSSEYGVSGAASVIASAKEAMQHE